ncbi:response regulator [Undibacter mobilis]|uniref:Response regulator n=1 Tax=Undibacter mobilis TaxID=2292256 RepID=A0A371B8Z9_9BRAD|nr:response regulator [Undibacter mobilis]RDV04012.1 response regulator [Undibacter mobilis]
MLLLTRPSEETIVSGKTLTPQRDGVVLLVEDDRDFVSELRPALEAENLNIKVAETAEDALAILEVDRQIDIVITDIMLPTMSGLELLKRVKTLRRERKIIGIILTAHASIDYAVTALRQNAVDFLQKPIHFDELMEAIDRARANLRSVAKANSAEIAPDVASLLSFASTLRESREVIGLGGISECAWQMLIYAALCQQRGQKITVTALCAASGAPIPTALRHLSGLEKRELILRHPDPDDRRCIIVSISKVGTDYLQRAMRRWVERSKRLL